VEESNRMFVQSFERGLESSVRSTKSVLANRSAKSPERTGYSRASCRRLLFTLETLGYVGVDGREFFLPAPNTRYRVLVPHVTAVSRHRRALRPGLSDKVRESVSVSVLDGSTCVRQSRRRRHAS